MSLNGIQGHKRKLPPPAAVLMEAAVGGEAEPVVKVTRGIPKP